MDFDEDASSDQRQLDAEWMALNAVRETLGIANRGVGDSTYLEALAVGRDAAPRLFDPAFSVLASGQEPPLVREYRQKAEARSALQGRAVSPMELIDKDIAEYEALMNAPGGARRQLRRAFESRLRAREWLQDRPYSEHKLIERCHRVIGESKYRAARGRM